MVGYKVPCRYCHELVSSDAKVCPLCGKVNPAGSPRCPKCLNPVKPNWKNCEGCGLKLETACPKCAQPTFFGDYCDKCGARLTVVCAKCRTEQPPLGDNCVKCGQPLQGGK
ncbi:MAG: hypothetical protein WC632_05140 [Candidatus Margulisiibacteriota bacterium]